jgi:hypothetical protein
MALGLRNLAAIWQNYRAVGAERLILADVVERRGDVALYAEAVPGAVVQVVRLHASLPTLLAQLRQREEGNSLDWHSRRAAELIAIMDREQIGDLHIDTDDRSEADIADEILQQSGWVR